MGSFVAHNLALSLLVLGRWDECQQLTSRLLAGDAWNRFGLLTVHGWLLTWRGGFAASREVLEQSVRLSPSAFAHDPRLALAELAVWEGRHDDAQAEIAAGLRWCTDHDPEGAQFHRSSPWYPLALRLAADRAEYAAARRATDQAAEARHWAEPVIAQLDRLATAAAPQAHFPEVACNLPRVPDRGRPRRRAATPGDRITRPTGKTAPDRSDLRRGVRPAGDRNTAARPHPA